MHQIIPAQIILPWTIMHLIILVQIIPVLTVIHLTVIRAPIIISHLTIPAHTCRLQASHREL